RRRHTRSKRDWSSDVCSSDLGPDSVQRAVGAYSSRESFHRAIIVARQPAMGIDFQGWRPGLAVVAGARQKDLRIRQRPAGPAHVKIPRVRSLGVVGHDVGLVLPGNARLGRMLKDGDVLGLPGLAAVEGAPNEQAVARGVVRPIIAGA